MNTKEALSIEEGNRAIMFFDGAENTTIDIMGEDVPAIKWKGGYYPPDKLPNFNEDWNLLMPVVEKIGSIPVCFNVDINTSEGVGIYDDNFKSTAQGKSISSGINGTLIQLTWRTIVIFIQWFNNTQSIKK